MNKKNNFVLIYKFLINGSSVVMFGIMYLQTSTLWEKYKESIKRSKIN